MGTCQKSWADRYSAEIFDAWFGTWTLESFSIIGFVGRPVTGNVQVLINGGTPTQAALMLHLVKEKPPTKSFMGGVTAQPSEDGEWGVNPISALRKEKKQ